MKSLVILFLALFLFACIETDSQNKNISNSPKTEPTPTDSQKEHYRKYKEKHNLQLRDEIKKISKDFRVLTLENQNLSKNDLEVRIWRFSAFGDKDLIFILKRTNENWSADLVGRKIAEKDIEKDNPPRKFFKSNLGKPKSDWESFWTELVDAEILVLSEVDEIGNEPCPDCWLYILETKINGNYSFVTYHAPEVNKNTYSSKQMIKIINLISDEFSLDAFNADNFQKP